MLVELHFWPPGTRESDFAFCIGDSAIFADFKVDDEGLVFLVRISFDGFGCCTLDAKSVTRMTRSESEAICNMATARSVDVARAEPILRRHFAENQAIIWADALKEHDLI